MNSPPRRHKAPRGPSWGERIALRLIGIIPEQVAVAPERALINFACILIGISTLLHHNAHYSVLAAWPHWLVVEFSLGMIIGGAVTLTGVIYEKWSLARAGMLLILLCTAYYGLSSLFIIGLRGLPTALLYLSITVAKTIRLTVSSASRGRFAQQHKDGDKDLD